MNETAPRGAIDIGCFLVQHANQRTTSADAADEQTELPTVKRLLREVRRAQHRESALVRVRRVELRVKIRNKGDVCAPRTGQPINGTFVPRLLRWSRHHVDRRSISFHALCDL